VRYLAGFVVIFCLLRPNLYSYSVLTHEAIVDSVWMDSIQPLLLQRFPGSNAQTLKTARAYAYGGCIVQDMGYYPFGSHFFTNLTHYVRSGDFVQMMLRESNSVYEYAFALGALAHYVADTDGHSLAINRAVPLLYKKLQRKYGDEVTYADDPGAHIKTEFAFDVLQVAKGHYASDGFHDYIGFEVSKPLLERAFSRTYSLELNDVFGALDLSIGTYRRTVSGLIPQMTQVAWDIKKDDIQKSQPGITRDKFLYNVSRARYESDWGTEYRKPGIGSRVLGFFFRVFPKIGPFRALSFRTPTPETEKLFMDSFNKTLEHYRALLAAERARRGHLADENLDIGKPSTAGAYKLADETYSELLDRLAKADFAGLPADLRTDILNFYNNGSSIPSNKHANETAKLRSQLELLRGATAYSRP
jgi:hypothetical protein